MQKLAEIFPKKYHDIFDSILPGGNSWHQGDMECLESCPYHSSCNDMGPSRKLCSEDWRAAPFRAMVLMVIKHVFDNFDYYNCKDLPYSENATVISEIRDILDFPFDESLSPAETKAVVNIRLKQAEFKNNLFSLWGGCSLSDCEIDSKYLIASHIVPWAKSTDEEKVSRYNGLLLPANYDYLFDRHLISFSQDGNLLLPVVQSNSLKSLYRILGINSEARLGKPYSKKGQFSKIEKFMQAHRKQFEMITTAISKESLIYSSFRS